MSETNVVGIRTIDEAIRIVERKWERADEADQKAKGARLEAALELRSLKLRIENGEDGDEAALDWWDWYGSKFRRSRADAELLLTIAYKDDPAAAMAKENERNRKNVQAFRQRARNNGSGQASAYKGDVSGHSDLSRNTEPRVVTAPPKIAPSPEEDALVAQFIELFRKMSDDTRVRAMQEITALYRRWREGEE